MVTFCARAALNNHQEEGQESRRLHTKIEQSRAVGLLPDSKLSVNSTRGLRMSQQVELLTSVGLRSTEQGVVATEY